MLSWMTRMPDSFLDTGMLKLPCDSKPGKIFVTRIRLTKNLDFEDLSDLPDMEVAQIISQIVVKPWKKHLKPKG